MEDVRRIGLSLLETSADERGVSVKYGSKQKGFCWTWAERIEPKRPKEINPEVLAIRTPDLDARDALIMSDPEKFFTEPHYNGYPAVLVRLKNIELDELEELLIEGWRCMAPKVLVKEYDQGKRI